MVTTTVRSVEDHCGSSHVPVMFQVSERPLLAITVQLRVVIIAVFTSPI